MFKITFSALCASFCLAGAAHAATVAVTEGFRPTEPGSTYIGEVTTFDLNSFLGGSLDLGETLVISGRVGQGLDTYTFTSTAPVKFTLTQFELDQDGTGDRNLAKEPGPTGPRNGTSNDPAPGSTNTVTFSVAGGAITDSAILNTGDALSDFAVSMLPSGPISFSTQGDDTPAHLFTVEVAAIPVPAALPLLGGGIGALAALRRRRRARD